MDNILYFLNKLECPRTRLETYLDKTKFLSEFENETERAVARANLGITDIIEELRLLILAAVLNPGTATGETTPTIGNTTKFVTSDGLARYLNTLFTGVLEAINNKFDSLNRELDLICAELDKFATKNLLASHDIEANERLNDSLESFSERLTALEVKVKSFLKSSAEGTVLNSQFGNSEDEGINLKTITEAFNKIWDKIYSLTGEASQGIDMIVSPTYFYGNSTNVEVLALIGESSAKFDSIKFYIVSDLTTLGNFEQEDPTDLGNDDIFREFTNVGRVTFTTEIGGTVAIGCSAIILGQRYTKIKTVTQSPAFWIATSSDSTLSELPANSQNIINGSGSYDISCNAGDYIYIIADDSNSFVRADMNSIEIPFEEAVQVTIDGSTYSVYKSVNTYMEGKYNIDINK